MAVQTITYDNKSYLNQNANIPNVNKVTDSDMNEIKTVVNNNASELTGLANQFGDYIVEEGGDFSTNLYIKYANGIMVQYGRIQVSVAISTALGSVFRTSSTVQKNLVESFYDTSYVIVTTANAALNAWYTNASAKTVNSFDGYAIAYTSTTALTRYIDFIAIGRWKE